MVEKEGQRRNSSEKTKVDNRYLIKPYHLRYIYLKEGKYGGSSKSISDDYNKPNILGLFLRGIAPDIGCPQKKCLKAIFSIIETTYNGYFL